MTLENISCQKNFGGWLKRYRHPSSTLNCDMAFSVYLHDLTGQVFSMFILTVAAAEAAIGLAILVTAVVAPTLPATSTPARCSNSKSRESKTNIVHTNYIRQYYRERITIVFKFKTNTTSSFNTVNCRI